MRPLRVCLRRGPFSEITARSTKQPRICHHFCVWCLTCCFCCTTSGSMKVDDSIHFFLGGGSLYKLNLPYHKSAAHRRILFTFFLLTDGSIILHGTEFTNRSIIHSFIHPLSFFLLSFFLSLYFFLSLCIYMYLYRALCF